MTILARFVQAALAAALLLTPVLASDLPRRASLGLKLSAPPQGEGARVDEVFPGQSGAALGIRRGDVVVAAGGRPVAGVSALIDYAGTLAAGDAVDLKVMRDGKAMSLAGKAVGRPRETYPNAAVDYGGVPFRDGRLADILVTPTGATQPPVAFLLQGFSCASIEPAQASHSYRRLGDELVARGIAYYRVEKPGMGDSIGSLRCQDIDYATELDAFRSAYRHLIETRGVDPDRIFMFGHSLGGLQAPMLAAERAPRGVAAYGTVLRNWADYHRNVDTFQSYLISGEDPVAAAEGAERNRDLFRLYYFDRMAPAAIAAARPNLADPLRNLFGWEGERSFGRHYKFMADLAHQPIFAAWRGAKSNVLALYGESDLVAVFDTDHRLIADIANWYRPGSGRYIEIAGTDHGMTLVGNRQDFRRRTIAAGQPPAGAFNPAVVEALADWIKESMAKPPVRTWPDRRAPG